MAIANKHVAENTSRYEVECVKCRLVLTQEHDKYKAKLRVQIAGLSRGSKRWWRLNKQPMDRQSKASFFPPMRDAHGEWHRDPEKKANLFVECWSSKNKLPDEQYEQAFFVQPPQMASQFVIRRRTARRLLSALREDQATGPDDIGAVILKRLAKYLAVPLAILCRRIFSEATWPAKWRRHNVMPLFKKGSPYLPNQYRGIHLTAILSKTVERMIGQTLVPFLESKGFGNAQWAFRKRSSARDLVTMCLAKWIHLICTGFKIGVYLSDISGAFDKVNRCLLLGKLAQFELPDTFLDFLN